MHGNKSKTQQNGSALLLPITIRILKEFRRRSAHQMPHVNFCAMHGFWNFVNGSNRLYSANKPPAFGEAKSPLFHLTSLNHAEPTILNVGDRSSTSRFQLSPKPKKLNLFLHRLLLGSFYVVLIFFCSYGVLSLGMDLMGNERIGHCGKIFSYVTADGHVAMDIAAILNMKSPRMWEELERMDEQYVLVDAWGDMPVENSSSVKLTFRFIEMNDTNVIQEKASNHSRNRTRHTRSLEAIASSRDSFPVRLYVDEEERDDNNDDDDFDFDFAVGVNSTDNVLNPGDQVYAEKCKQWINQKQQEKLFRSAYKELTNIRGRLEDAMKSGKTQMDVKEPREDSDHVDDDRLLVQRTLYEILTRFSDADKVTGNREVVMDAPPEDTPVWARDW